jgi:hypothetical protein
MMTDPAECLSAITAADATMMSRAAVRAIALTSNQAVAGDVSGNGRVTGFDAALTAQRALSSPPEQCLAYRFPVSVHDWTFRPVERVFTPLQGGEDYGFVGIVYGDVTGNWAPSSGFAGSPDVLDASGVKLPTGAPTGALGIPAQSGTTAELYLAAGPSRTEDGHWQAVIGMQNADGILGLDLTLPANPATVQILGVGATGIASTFGYAAKNTGDGYLVSMYDLGPMAGSGAFLVVTYDLTGTASGLPFGVTAEANEGRITVVPGPGIPRGGTHEPEVQVDQQ